MPRIPRNRLGAGVFHVLNRAHDRAHIFADDADKAVFVALLAEGARRHHLEIYHWVVMGNHYHLAVEALTARDLSAFASQAQSGYCAHWRRRHGGSGTLWQGRFKSVVVQKDGYLNELGRYIELNPVRAGLAVEPCEAEGTFARRRGRSWELTDIEAEGTFVGTD